MSLSIFLGVLFCEVLIDGHMTPGSPRQELALKGFCADCGLDSMRHRFCTSPPFNELLDVSFQKKAIFTFILSYVLAFDTYLKTQN